MTDKTPGACQCHEKHAPTYWKGVVREYKDALEKAESRPLTPDAITDEMVERAREVFAREDWVQPLDPETACELDHKDHADATRVITAALAAALTEPPKRPEGAEGIEAAFDTWEHAEYLNGAIDAYDKRALADHIAEEMSR